MSIVEGEPIQNTVFVGDLHIHCTEAELQALFGPFGTITAVKIMRSQETGRNLSYGFVYYLHRDAAVAAINNLDGYLLRGRSLRVKWAAYKDKTGKNGQSKNQGNSSAEDTDKTPVHFSFISHQNEVVVTEEMLRYMFGKHGKVLDVSIRKLVLDHKHQSGYGFVYYAATPEGTQSGLNAVKAYADYEANGIHYQCHISHRMDQQLQHLKVKSANDLSSMPSQGNAPELNNQGSSAPVHLSNVVDQLGAMAIKDNSTKVSNARKAQDAQANKFNQNQFSRTYAPKNVTMYPQQKQPFVHNIAAGSQTTTFRSQGEEFGYASNIPAGFQTSYRTQVEEHGFAPHHNISSGPRNGAFRTQADERGYGSQMAGLQNNGYKTHVDEGHQYHNLTGSQANNGFRAQGDRRFMNSFQHNNRENPHFPVNYAESPIAYGRANPQPVAVSSAHTGHSYNSKLSGSGEGEVGAFDQDFRRTQILYPGEPYPMGQHRMPPNDVVIGKSSYVHHQSIIHPRDSRLSMNPHHLMQRNEIDQTLMGNNPPKKGVYSSESEEVPMSFFSATKSQSRLGLQYGNQPTSVIYSQQHFSHSNVQILSPIAGTRALNLQQPLFEKSNLYLVQPVTTSVLSSPVSPIQSPLIMHHIPIQSLSSFHSVLPSPMGYHIFGNSGDLHYSPMRPQQSPLEFFGSGFVQADYASKVMKAPNANPHSYQDPNPMEPVTPLEIPSHTAAVREQFQPAKEFAEDAPATAEENGDGSADSHPVDVEESNYDCGAGEHSTSLGGAPMNAADASNQKAVTKTRKSAAANRLKNMTTTVTQPVPFVN